MVFTLKQLSEDEKIRMQCEARERYERDLLSEYASGKAAGYASGKAAGYASGEAAGYASGKAAGYASGETAGYTAGEASGEANINALNSWLILNGRNDDLIRSVSDRQFQLQLMEEYKKLRPNE